MEKNPIITIQDLTKKFPVGKSFFTALNGVNLDFFEGEFTGLIGPSGSGKTTLLNIIGTLDAPTSGKVQVLGADVAHLLPKRQLI
jgi:putative ABC transport system ATP-binding protein